MEEYKNIFNTYENNKDAAGGAADPFIYKYNGKYYLLCTRDKGLVLMESNDLISFSYVNKNGGIVSEDLKIKAAYAPELSYFNGVFYIIASPMGNGHHIYASNDIIGPYRDITGNIDELIDGSFFNDNDGRKYLLRASETGITVKEFKDKPDSSGDFRYFKDNYYNIENSKIGSWTEGPYLLKRYGYYYLTYTGTHFLSDAYRVDYVSSRILNKNSFSYKGTLLISTTDKFYGLGHSMTVLGPDLDSYYIVYHNMMSNNNRYMNLSRLLFSKNGEMLVNLNIDKNPTPARPEFETYVKTSSYLTKKSYSLSKKSIEYNFSGKDCRLILGYIDLNCFNYIKLLENKLLIVACKNGINEVIKEIPLSYTFKLDVYHSLRMQLKGGICAIYLDNIEISYDLRLDMPKGKIGYMNNELMDAYLAISNEAMGSSDKVTVVGLEFFIENLKRSRQVSSGRIMIPKEGIYKLYLETGCRECNMVSIDDKVIGNDIRLSGGYTYLGSVKLSPGAHEIKICGASKGRIKIIREEKNEHLDLDKLLAKSDVYHKYLMINSGVYFENDRNAILTKSSYTKYDVSTLCRVVGSPNRDDTFIGLIASVNNYSKSNEFENAYSLMGYMLTINEVYAYIIEASYNYSRVLKKLKIASNCDYRLRIKKSDNEIKFYINDECVYSSTDIKYPTGRIGIYNNHASGIFKKFTVED